VVARAPARRDCRAGLAAGGRMAMVMEGSHAEEVPQEGIFLEVSPALVSCRLALAGREASRSPLDLVKHPPATNMGGSRG